jgi:hypothetical protein
MGPLYGTAGTMWRMAETLLCCSLFQSYAERPAFSAQDLLQDVAGRMKGVEASSFKSFFLVIPESSVSCQSLEPTFF